MTESEHHHMARNKLRLQYTPNPDMPFEPLPMPTPDPWSQGVWKIRALEPSYDVLLKFFRFTAEDAYIVGLHQKSSNDIAFRENTYNRVEEILHGFKNLDEIKGI